MRGRFGVEADFAPERKVDERHNAEPARFAFDLLGHGPEREAVDHDRCAIRQRSEHTRGRGQRRCGGSRKCAIELPSLDRPSARAQSGNDPAVVFVSARSGLE